MKCLYEVLGVEPSVDDAAVRSAYRKMALQYHPDKNQHDPTAAEERFKEVQNAYEILSDKQERAWYDSHRDAILRSGERHQAGTAGEGMGERPDDFVDVYSYFTSTCYSGFGDGPRGFFTVYDNLFSTLAEQEAAASAARAERRGSSAPTKLPGFGLSGAEWPGVAAFYAEWSNFSSARDFSWADEYNPASAPNRQVRRAMEQDNERKRKAARKEYNEGVRSLVDFVKKRDKRVAAHAVEEAKRRQEREAADAERREREKQERAARAAAYQAAAWAASDSSDGDSEEGDPYLEEQLIWHCPVCDKHFKSEASMANHERSKRHRELVELLRLELEAEEAELGGADFATAAVEEKHEEALSDEEDDASISDVSSSGSESEAESESETEDESGSSEEEASSASSSESEEIEEEEHEEEDEEAMLARLMSHASLNRAAGRDSSDDEEALEEVEAEEIVEEEKEEVEEEPPLGGLAAAASSDDDDWGAGKKAAKKKGKRAGKAGGGVEAPAPQPVPQPVPQPAPQTKVKAARKKGSNGGAAAVAAEPESELMCSICRFEFASRYQLFKHIKQTGHAQLKYR